MATTLQRILAERAAQRAEEVRPPFCTVEALRTFIEEQAPAQYENISVEMCVLRMEDRQLCWKLDLIDKALEPEFDALARASASLDSARRNKFVFQLNLWKISNPFYNDITCCEGWTYRFVWLHGFPQTSTALRNAIQCDEQFRNRLIELADSVLTTKPPCMNNEGDCPVCHASDALDPVLPGVDAFRRPAPRATAPTTANCCVRRILQ